MYCFLLLFYLFILGGFHAEDFELNGLNKENNALQKQIAAKKKVSSSLVFLVATIASYYVQIEQRKRR